MLYADVSTSYRFQGQTMPDADGNYPPPEEMTAYTLGAKNRFFDNKLQVNVSAYWYDYKNKFASGNPTWFIYMWEDDTRILNAADPETGLPLNYTFVDKNGVTHNGIDLNGDRELNNADNPGGRGMQSLADAVRAKWGDYRSRGIDLQTNWIITMNDRLDFSYSYGDNVWTDLYYKYVYNWIYPDVDLSGVMNVNSPKHTMVLTYNHNFNLPNGGTFSTRIDTRYQTEYVISFKKADTPYRDQEAYHTTGLSLIYANPDGKWTLTGYAKNIENYAVKRSLFGRGEDPENQKMIYEMMIGSPRTYGAVLSVKF
jgi:iron complex outermembrane receptor protein